MAALTNTMIGIGGTPIYTHRQRQPRFLEMSMVTPIHTQAKAAQVLGNVIVIWSYIMQQNNHNFTLAR